MLPVTMPAKQPYATLETDSTPAEIRGPAGERFGTDVPSGAVGVLIAVPQIWGDSSDRTGGPPAAAPKAASMMSRAASETSMTAAERANHDRIALLARQYARKSLSLEDEGRLQIATERVDRLIPRVTAQDFEALEELIHRQATMSASIDADMKALGLEGLLEG